MSLVTVARYRAITGDTATTASTVTARIEDAVDLLEEVLDRPLESAERTEALTPTRDGKLWPRAVPVTDPGDYTVDGLALKGGMFGSTTFTVTYTGGWVEPSDEREGNRDRADERSTPRRWTTAERLLRRVRRCGQCYPFARPTLGASIISALCRKNLLCETNAAGAAWREGGRRQLRHGSIE